MALTGKQKAAMLLMTLDAGTATELLKDVDPKVVEELVLETAYLDATGLSNKRNSLQLAQQFCDSLKSGTQLHVRSFLGEMLKKTVGNEKAEHIQTHIQDMLQKRDPFIAIRSADSRAIASIMENEHPQATAVVLSELDAKKSSEVLGFLSEGIRLSVIRRMTGSGSITPEAKSKIAKMVCQRLKGVTAGTVDVPVDQKKSLRKVAVMLRNLSKELRDGLFSGINNTDSKAGQMVADLMITWEDVPQLTNRSLQKALRGIDAWKLAIALCKSDLVTIDKIKANLSERAAASIKEETSIMSAPNNTDILEAREEIVSVLREMNHKGEVSFTEE